MNNYSPEILVIGTGAIGALYAAKLSESGTRVSVICRSDYDKVKQDGFDIKSCWGDLNFKPQDVFSDVGQYKDKYKKSPDFILVATKVLPEISIPDIISPIIGENTAIIMIQNGIFIEDSISQAFPNNHLISTIAFVDVIRSGLGSIIHAGDGKLTFGSYKNDNSSKIKRLIDLFEKVNVPCVLVKDIQMERWKKLLWNASFNPISVIAGGLNTKEMLDNDLIKDLIRSVMREVIILAKSDGYEIPESFMEDNIASTYARRTPSRTSMLLDFEAGRNMEVDAILGNTINFAKNKSISIPYISSLYSLISCYKKPNISK